MENKPCSSLLQSHQTQQKLLQVSPPMWGTQNCADVLTQRWQAKLLSFTGSLQSMASISAQKSIPFQDHDKTTQQPRLPLDQGSLSCCAQGTNNREKKTEELDELCSTRSMFGNTDFKVAWECWKRPTWFYRCQFCNKPPLKFKAELRQTVL